MKSIQTLTSKILKLTSFTIALTIELFNIASVSAQTSTPVSPSTSPDPSPETSVYDPPPDLGAPTRTESGAKRPNGKCPSDREIPQLLLTALVPNNTNVTLTLASRPTFFFYIPQTSATTAEFILKDEEDEDVYRTYLTIPNKAGIISFRLPTTAPELNIGKNYEWHFAVRCVPNNTKQDLAVSGWIWRTQLRPSITSELQEASPRNAAQLYRKYKIWHEALASLAELRRSNPNDSQIIMDWQELLESAGLSEFKEMFAEERGERGEGLGVREEERFTNDQ